MTTRSSESACSECSKTTPELAVIGEASNGAEAVEFARELAPQVVVMDLEMPIMDGIQAARHILRLAPATAILMLSMSAEETCVRNAFEAGAQGYLLKNAVDLDLGGAVKAVASGKRVLRIVFGAVVGDLAVETIYNGLGGKI